MNLTKSLKWAMICAGATAFSVSAQNVWVDDTFDIPGGNPGVHIWTADGGNWARSGDNDASVIANADPARNAFNASSTPLEGTDDLVLELNTEGDTLIRTLPSGIDFKLAPVYVDMMVKFVLSEEEPDVPSGSVKAMVFANANSNLVVYSSDMAGGVFSELDAQVNPENWYRLTLTWRWDDIWEHAFFQIELNGNAIVGPSGFAWNLDDYYDPDGTWFITVPLTDTDLSSIEFQGTGFIDELVVTDIEPDFGDPVSDVFFAGTNNKVDLADYTAWLFAKGLGTPENNTANAGMWKAYLLNVDPGNGSIEAKLTIIDIVPATGGGAIVQLGAVNGLGNPVEFKDAYGTLELYRTPSLETPFVEFDSIPKPKSDKHVVIGNGDKYFYRARIR